MLSEQQIRFADYYIQNGNGTESYKLAGYKAKGHAAETASSRLLRNVEVVDYIKERNKSLIDNRIADMEEVKRFWTNTMRSNEAELKDRLKASEYIAKTNAAFIENHKHSGETGVRIINDIPRNRS
jgi:phage terminase small subunit